MADHPSRIIESRLPRIAGTVALAALLVPLTMMPGMPVPADRAGARAQAFQTFSTAPLSIVSGGTRHQFVVELAITPPQRSQGLMFRRELAPDRGMLFVFDHPQVVNMWMENTLIPLDMLFIDQGGEVVAIHERAIPESRRIISSGRRVAAVLELPGGSVDRLHLKVGDRVLSQALG